jgi:hypothetical protein
VGFFYERMQIAMYEMNGSNTNVIYRICQYFINLTVVNADGIKQIVQ